MNLENFLKELNKLSSEVFSIIQNPQITMDYIGNYSNKSEILDFIFSEE